METKALYLRNDPEAPPIYVTSQADEDKKRDLGYVSYRELPKKPKFPVMRYLADGTARNVGSKAELDQLGPEWLDKKPNLPEVPVLAQGSVPNLVQDDLVGRTETLENKVAQLQAQVADLLQPKGKKGQKSGDGE